AKNLLSSSSCFSVHLNWLRAVRLWNTSGIAISTARQIWSRSTSTACARRLITTGLQSSFIRFAELATGWELWNHESQDAPFPDDGALLFCCRRTARCFVPCFLGPACPRYPGATEPPIVGNFSPHTRRHCFRTECARRGAPRHSRAILRGP